MSHRAKYTENANVWGRVAENRFDLDPKPPSYQPAPQEVAAEAFGNLAQQEQDELQGWAVSNLEKVTPRAPWDGGPKTGLLKPSALATDAGLYVGRSVNVSEVAGALLSLGFHSVTTGWGPADIQFAAGWKDT